jgi:hypothetical protein
MPNRILKQSICTSPNIDSLGFEAETLFYRLLVQCDDFGQFFANPSILRGLCFPMKINGINEEQIVEWFSQIVDAGLVWTYQVENVSYLQVTKWESHQQMRARRHKFPEPPEGAYESAQLKSSDINGNHVISDAKTIQSNPIQLPKPTSKPKRKSVASATGRKQRAPDPRSASPEIQLFREITSTYPEKENYDAVIDALRDKTKEQAEPYFKRWLTVSKNKNNLSWLLDWMTSGKPPGEFGAGAKRNGNERSATIKSGVDTIMAMDWEGADGKQEVSR